MILCELLKSKSSSNGILALVWAAFLAFTAAAADDFGLKFREIDPVEVKTGRHSRVVFNFGVERVGYVSIRGKRIGDALSPLSDYRATIADALEPEDVKLHAAICPIDLSQLSFECSDGKLAAFWDDCLRLTENRQIARRMGDKALEERFASELKETFAKAMPSAAGNANPLGVIVRQYLGISTDDENARVEIYPKLVQGMARMAGSIPTRLGRVGVDARHLRGNDYTIDVEVPGKATARVIAPVWGVASEVDGIAAKPRTITASDGKKRYAFAIGGGKHTIRLKAPPRKIFPEPAAAYDMTKIQMEKLSRGLVAVRDRNMAVISWRYLPSDPTNIAFHVYENGNCITKRNPLKNTSFTRTKFREGAKYEVCAVDDSVMSAVAVQTGKPYLKIPLKQMPDGYWTEEASVGDVDGDGDYELFVKRSPQNSKDNAQAGMTDPTLIECYQLDGTFLWQINLGRNIRSGAHYTQFMVFDFDCDGKAEMICKTADGTIDGKGNAIGEAKADWVSRDARTLGKILDGPEYLTLFDGLTGAALDTVPYDPPRGNLSDWGDDYGNRADRFLACVAYLDGIHPSAVFCRGYYAKTVLAAWDWDGKKLKKRWRFDSTMPGNEAYGGQGFHSVRVADVDFDGRDEIVYGSMVVDDDGKGLYSTGLEHGDGLHLVQASPHLRGFQVWTCHEHPPFGLAFRYAQDGKIIWQQQRNYDVPTCVAADFDPTNPGYELWMGKNEPYWDLYGRELAGIDHLGWSRDLVWWKGDLLRSRIAGSWKLNHWNWHDKKWEMDYVFKRDVSNAITKSPFPILVADILGDWREEVVLPGDKGNSLLVFVSSQPTEYRFWPFMLDPVYRLSVTAWNVGYNQATQAGFYFGPDLLGHDIWFRGMFLGKEK